MGGQRFTWCLTWDREAHLVPQRLTWWLTFDPEAHLVADWCPRGSPSALHVRVRGGAEERLQRAASLCKHTCRHRSKSWLTQSSS